MCRIVLLWGDFDEDFPPIFQSFADIATEDPVRSKEVGKKVAHKDGWGLLNVTSERIVLDKRSTSLTRDTELPKVFNGALMMHTRAAAPNEGMGVLNNHPFHLSDEKYDVYIVHNGWFDKYKINEAIGYSHPELINDTEIFADFFMSLEGDMKTRISKALEISKQKEYIKGGANIYVIVKDRETLETSIFYHADNAPGKEFTEYNRLYAIGNGKWKGIISSSLIYSSHFPKSLNPTEIERGKLYSEELKGY